MNEAAHASPLGTTLFDSMLGLAIRRHCAPVLDLEPLAAADDYLARRRRARAQPRSTAGFLAAAGIDTYLVDTGLATSAGRWSRRTDELADAAPAAPHARSSGSSTSPSRCCAPARPTSPATSPSGCGRPRRAGAVGAKSIAAYRVGLGLPADKPERPTLDRALAGVNPTRAGVDAGGERWLAHTALEVGLPLQLHVGVRRQRPRPARLRPAAADGVPARDRGARGAGAAAAQLPATTATRPTSPRSSTTSSSTSASPPTTPARCRPRSYRETLELAPFGKLLFSTDAYGLAELYLLGSAALPVAGWAASSTSWSPTASWPGPTPTGSRGWSAATTPGASTA